MRSLLVADKTAKQRVAHDCESAEQEIKQKLEQATWLADSVLEAAQIQVKDEAKAAKKAYAGQIQSLAEIETRTLKLLQLYGHPIPPEPTAAAPAGPEAAAGKAPAPQSPAADPLAEFESQRERANGHLSALTRLQIPRMFVGARPILTVLFFGAMAVVFAQALYSGNDLLNPAWKGLGIFLGGTTVLLTAGGVTLRLVGKSQTYREFLPLRQAVLAARQAAASQLEAARKAQEAKYAEAVEKRKAEEQSAREKAAPLMAQITKRRDDAIAALAADFLVKKPAMEQQYQDAKSQLEESHRKAMDDLQSRYDGELKAVKDRHERHNAESLKRYQEARAALERRLNEGLAQVQAPIEEKDELSFHSWDDPVWKNWMPPKTFAAMVRFGELRVDLNKIADSVPKKAARQLQLPEAFTVPTSLAFPRQASLVIQTDHEGREEAMRTLQMLMVRLLTCLPAGRVRFTLIDPVGLGQSFAGFMHLADHDDALVGGRIWTDGEHIEQRLTDLTEHMETVIQKYLRNEYETIDDYNAQAGELAEPYRFLVIADFPAGMEGESLHRLSSIASTGARCGVYTLIMRDLRQPLPSGFHVEELEARSVNIVREDGAFVWKDEVFRKFPLTLDPPPSEDFLTRMLDVVGRHAKVAKRVEVPFEAIAPSSEDFWSGKSNSEIVVPMGAWAPRACRTCGWGAAWRSTRCWPARQARANRRCCTC